MSDSGWDDYVAGTSPPGPGATRGSAPEGSPAPEARPVTEGRSGGDGPSAPEGRSGRSARFGHRTGGGVARTPIVLAVAALLAAGGLADRQHRTASADSGVATRAVSLGAPATALSSSWFCAGATDSAGSAPGQLVLANASGRPLQAVIKLVSNAGQAPAPVTVTVGPRSRQVVPEVASSSAPWLGAVVDLDGGDATVEQQVVSPLGVAATPCATSGSAQWYFTSGATLVNASMVISLLNPYPSDAIVDLSFTTDQGVEEPGDFQALVVPAGGLLAVDVGTHLRRRLHVATRVTARVGRVVAWKTDVVSPPATGEPRLGPDGSATAGSTSSSGATAPSAGDPASPVAGITLTLGAPVPAIMWSWPDGVTGDGVDERYVIFNPNAQTAKVQLAFELEQGSAEPFSLSVGPDSVTTVVSSDEARVPAGVAHAAVLRSVNGVAVVAERVVSAAAPSQASGLGEIFGAGQPAERWLLGAGATSSDLTMWVVLLNPGAAPVTVNISGIGASVPGLAGITVPAGGRQAVRVNDHAAALDVALLVTSTGPVFAERDLYGAKHGVSLSIAAPLSGS